MTAPAPVAIHKLWPDPRSGKLYAVLTDRRISDGLSVLEGWRYAAFRDRSTCISCGGWTRARDPDDMPRHPSCATDKEGTP